MCVIDYLITKTPDLLFNKCLQGRDPFLQQPRMNASQISSPSFRRPVKGPFLSGRERAFRVHALRRPQGTSRVLSSPSVEFHILGGFPFKSFPSRAARFVFLQFTKTVGYYLCTYPKLPQTYQNGSKNSKWQYNIATRFVPCPSKMYPNFGV
jgi:hypothetical protein